MFCFDETGEKYYFLGPLHGGCKFCHIKSIFWYLSLAHTRYINTSVPHVTSTQEPLLFSFLISVTSTQICKFNTSLQPKSDTSKQILPCWIRDVWKWRDWFLGLKRSGSCVEVTCWSGECVEVRWTHLKFQPLIVKLIPTCILLTSVIRNTMNGFTRKSQKRQRPTLKNTMLWCEKAKDLLMSYNKVRKIQVNDFQLVMRLFWIYFYYKLVNDWIVWQDIFSVQNLKKFQE